VLLEFKSIDLAVIFEEALAEEGSEQKTVVLLGGRGAQNYF
jgi:hypothetical protein